MIISPYLVARQTISYPWKGAGGIYCAIYENRVWTLALMGKTKCTFPNNAANNANTWQYFIQYYNNRNTLCSSPSIHLGMRRDLLAWRLQKLGSSLLKYHSYNCHPVATFIPFYLYLFLAMLLLFFLMGQQQWLDGQRDNAPLMQHCPLNGPEASYKTSSQPSLKMPGTEQWTSCKWSMHCIFH